MQIVYEPSGKAREYSPLAVNVYSGCNHACRYCYAPGIRQQTRDAYRQISPVKDAVKRFSLDCQDLYGSKVPVLFCFMTDPYNSLEESAQITRQCLELANKAKMKVKVLTKSILCLRDIELFKCFEKRISVGLTLTFKDKQKSIQWEPGAALPDERLNALRVLHNAGIHTWASFEPVIDPQESLMLIRDTLSFVDDYKIGKINNFEGLDKTINWTEFLSSSVAILRNANKNFYIKHDLREAASSIKLTAQEKTME
jgi:DNA repair photolyase